MSNVIPLHNTWLPEPEWLGAQEIEVGALPNGQTLEIIIDRTDDDEPLIVTPETPYDGPVGYTLSDEQAAQLTYAMYTAMSPSARAQFHQHMKYSG